MDDAWQASEVPQAPGAISIPTDGALGTAPSNNDDPNWNGGARSPSRGGDPPRRSSRSRSPGRGDRGSRNGGGGGGGPGDTNPGNNLHVSGLSYKVDSRDLEAAFSKIGRVKKASIMHDPHTRESRGFGFVTMETTEEAEAAIAALNASELMGKTMNVERARRSRARTPTPGRYYGPPKRHDPSDERPYDPRPYDSRYSRDYDDRRRGGRYDDYPPRRDYDRGGGGGYGREYREERGGDRYDRDYDRGSSRRYDDRRY